MALTTQQKQEFKACYDARNWLCIASWIYKFGKIILEYIKEIRQEKKRERGITITNKSNH